MPGTHLRVRPYPPVPFQPEGWRRPLPRVEIVDDAGRSLPTFGQGGREFLLGDVGERYRIRIVNPTPARIEAVVSVDGLDAVDGRPASLEKRGYVVPAFETVTVDGWRTSLDSVAAFRFSSVQSSYASRTGQDRNVGVIGAAFFPERVPLAWRAPESASRAAAAPHASGAGADRPGLGTRFGESHESHVQETTFVRADARPSRLVELRYDDRDGLLARGIRLPNDPRTEIGQRDRAEPFPDSRFAQPPR